MCGIAGSSKFKEFRDLYNLNKERGTFAAGILFRHKTGCEMLKVEGIADFNIIPLSSNQDEFDYFLLHTQAPTSSARTYSHTTSHPFVAGPWIVAHNGVITNDNELKSTINDKNAYNEVDSSVIPALLDQQYDCELHEADTICNVLSNIKGTFGLWIFNRDSGNTYIARSGSTLYGDFLTNSFSTLPYKDFDLLAEGTLYLLTDEGITAIGEFKSNSPFFVL